MDGCLPKARPAMGIRLLEERIHGAPHRRLRNHGGGGVGGARSPASTCVREWVSACACMNEYTGACVVGWLGACVRMHAWRLYLGKWDGEMERQSVKSVLPCVALVSG